MVELKSMSESSVGIMRIEAKAIWVLEPSYTIMSLGL